MPRAGVTQAAVVDEAERVADEIGLSRLTMAAVAARLGIRQPSLYKHVESMDALQRSISLRAKTELTKVMARAAIGRSRDDAIVALSHAYRRWAHEHPGRYAAAQRAPAKGDLADLDASREAVQVVFDILEGYDLRDEDAVDAARALRSALHGFVTLEAAGGFGLPVEVDRSFDRLVNCLTMALARWPAS